MAMMRASSSLQTWGIKSRQKLLIHFPLGGTIRAVVGTRNETKISSRNNIHDRGGGPRDVGWGGQAIKLQCIVHPYSTDMEELLKKPSKDTGDPSLGKSVITAASPARIC